MENCWEVSRWGACGPAVKSKEGGDGERMAPGEHTFESRKKKTGIGGMGHFGGKHTAEALEFRVATKRGI